MQNPTVTATDARFPGEDGRIAYPHLAQTQERRATLLMSYCTPLASNERAVSQRMSRSGLAGKQLRGGFLLYYMALYVCAPHNADPRFQRRSELSRARAVPPCPPTPPPPPPSRR